MASLVRMRLSGQRSFTYQTHSQLLGYSSSSFVPPPLRPPFVLDSSYSSLAFGGQHIGSLGLADGRGRFGGMTVRARKGRPSSTEGRGKKAGSKGPRKGSKMRVEDLLDEAESQKLSEEEFNAMLDELDAELEDDLKAGRIREVGGVLMEVDPEDGDPPAGELAALEEDEEEWKQKVVAEIKKWAEEGAESGESEGDFEEGDEFEEDFDEFDFEEFEVEGAAGSDSDEDGVIDIVAESPSLKERLPETSWAARSETSNGALISADLAPSVETKQTEESAPEEKAETPEEAEERAAMTLALSEVATWQERKLRWALEKSEHRRHKLQIKNIVHDTKLPRKVVLAWLKIHIKEPARPLEPAVSKADDAAADAPGEDAGEEEDAKWGPSKKRIKKVNLETFEKIYRISPQPSREQIQDLVKLTHIPYKTVVEWFDKRNGVVPGAEDEARSRRKEDRKKKKRGSVEPDDLVPMTMIEPESDGISIQS